MPVYYLKLRGPVHVGEAVSIDRETVLEWLPSDSLFGALVSAWKQLGADVNARLEAFRTGAPPLQITSALPWSANLRFYPAPVLALTSGLDGKAAKRVRWLSQGVFEQLRAGQVPNNTAETLLHDGAVWITPEELKSIPRAYADETGTIRLWRSYVVPRVTIDRTANASNLFHAGRVSFPAEGGWWFATRGETTDWVESALYYLSDAGLGGLRNYGHGAFTWQAAQNDLPEPLAQGAGISLARYAPASETEIQNTLQRDGAAYRLVTIGGWCTDDAGHAWRRRSVRMLAEGALLPDVTAARGQLVDVRPVNVPAFKERAVYRYGFPYFVPAGKLASEVTI